MKKINDFNLAIENARLLREHYLNDYSRPGYHFCLPEDNGMPGDPNGAFFANGRYHLMYLYACRSDGFRWGHISSIDLIHWRYHKDAIIPDDLDGGIFSGGAFVDDDNTCYLTYWGLPIDGKNNGGVRIIKSSDEHYDNWEKFEDYVLPCTESGVHTYINEENKAFTVGCADPSNIWKVNDTYYMQMGNLSVLLKFKRDGLNKYTKEDLEQVQVEDNIIGDWVELFKSKDLKNWEFVHRFYERDQSNKWTNYDEDDMCPSFLPLPKSKNGGELSDKYLQLFISHNRGCQFYIGDYNKEKEKFIPLSHGRMTNIDNTFFAPEALMDSKNRQIMWAWLLDNRENEMEKYAWSGVYGLPRSLWLNDDNTLGIAPVEEMNLLRYNKKEFCSDLLRNDFKLEGVNRTSAEINLNINMNNASKAGVILYSSEDKSEATYVYYDRKSNNLVFDASKSGNDGRCVKEELPFILKENENLTLQIYIDKSVVEVFANERQAITRRVYPSSVKNDNIYLYSDNDANFKSLTYYEMMPSNFN